MAVSLREPYSFDVQLTFPLLQCLVITRLRSTKDTIVPFGTSYPQQTTRSTERCLACSMQLCEKPELVVGFCCSRRCDGSDIASLYQPDTDLSARPIKRAIKQACHRGVGIVLFLDLGKSSCRNRLPLWLTRSVSQALMTRANRSPSRPEQNEQVVVNLYKILGKETRNNTSRCTGTPAYIRFGR